MSRLGRWSLAGGAKRPARLWGLTILIIDLAVGTVAIWRGVPIMGLVLYAMAAFVAWTLWEDSHGVDP